MELAVEAVTCEPVSVSILSFAGKYREEANNRGPAQLCSALKPLLELNEIDNSLDF